ncbi:hypothetical protein ACFL49_01555 [Candidatus Omnitrophota bacterium]
MTKKRKLSVWNKRAGKMTDAKVLKPRESKNKTPAANPNNSKAATFAKKFTNQIKKAAQ